VRPEDCTDLQDLRHFPFTTVADLRAGYPFGMLAMPREQVARIHASSGTTGTPTVVGYTTRDLELRADVMARSIRAAGGRPGDLVHIAYGYGLLTGGLGAHYRADAWAAPLMPLAAAR
jgi:phenylacetate-CoA ligase